MNNRSAHVVSIHRLGILVATIERADQDVKDLNKSFVSERFELLTSGMYKWFAALAVVSFIVVSGIVPPPMFGMSPMNELLTWTGIIWVAGAVVSLLVQRESNKKKVEKAKAHNAQVRQGIAQAKAAGEAALGEAQKLYAVLGGERFCPSSELNSTVLVKVAEAMNRDVNMSTLQAFAFVEQQMRGQRMEQMARQTLKTQQAMAKRQQMMAKRQQKAMKAAMVSDMLHQMDVNFQLDEIRRNTSGR